MKNRTIRLPDELDKLLKANADDANVTQAEYIRQIIQDGLDSNKPGKLLEELTWFHLQHKLVMGVAYVITLETNWKQHQAVKALKAEFPDLFDLVEKEEKRNRLDHEQYLLEQINEICTRFELGDLAKLTLSTLFLSITSVIHDGQIFEPFGLSLSWIDLYESQVNEMA